MHVKKTLQSGELEKEQEYYLCIADFVIRVRVSASEQLIYRKIFLENFERLWAGVMCKTPDYVDFEIACDVGEPSVKSIVKNKTHYMAGWVTDYKNRRIKIENLSSLWVLQLAIRQVVFHLLKGKGFLLHASAIMNQDKTMQLFLAESGGGKSTTARRMIELGAKHIADDSVIVKKVEGEWRCYGPGMVEKQYLARSAGSSNFALNCLIKSTNTRKFEPVNLAEKLSLVMKQVWLMEEGMNKSTYEMVVSFVKSAKIYKLELSLNSDKLREVMDEN